MTDEVPVSTAPKRALTTKPPRAIAGDLRAALLLIMRSMHAAGTEPWASDVLAALTRSALPIVQIGSKAFTTRIERFHERSASAGTKKGTIYDFIVQGNAISCKYGAFNNTVHELRKLITKDKSQPD